MENVSIVITPKVGTMADLFDEANSRGLTGNDFGDYVAKRLTEIGTDITVVSTETVKDIVPHIN